MYRRRLLFLGILLAFPLFAAIPVSAIQSRPVLEVKIPNVQFTNVRVTASNSEPGVMGYVDIPWLAQYLTGVYRYAAGIAGVLAGIMFMVGGFQYLTAGGNTSQLSKAKQRITDALVGLFLVLGTYVILSSINPELITFRSLRVKIAAKKLFSVEEEFMLHAGTLADDSAYSGPVPPVSAADPGRYRQQMAAVCGDRRGLDLPEEERIQRLRTIIHTWKKIGSDQGGAVYVRGGAFNCSYSNPQLNFVLNSMTIIMTGGRGGTATELQNVSESCKQVVRDAIAIPAGEARNAQLDAMAAPGGAATACYDEFKREYQQRMAVPAGNAGMACGDCFTFSAAMHKCFDDRASRSWSGPNMGWTIRGNTLRNCAGPSVFSPEPVRPGVRLGEDIQLVWRLKNQDITEENLARVVGHLKFGDMMGWNKPGVGHFYTYTGGASLGYQILEMGAGGSGDLLTPPGGVNNCCGILAGRNAGYPWVGSSGVRAHRDAHAFLRSVVRLMRSGATPKCMWAWRPAIYVPEPPPDTNAPREGTGQLILRAFNPLGVANFPGLAGRAIMIFFGMAGSMALLMFVYGAFVWVTAGGSPEKIDKGKKIFVWTTIGLFVIYASYAILQALFISLGLIR